MKVSIFSLYFLFLSSLAYWTVLRSVYAANDVYRCIVLQFFALFFCWYVSAQMVGGQGADMSALMNPMLGAMYGAMGMDPSQMMGGGA